VPNALAQETSPYLRQHAENPVDWLPWGADAFARARAEDKPVLVSIGYSACHWCHVMERESFEDAATAELMNECFVCVKVDREERPDVDALYMEAVQTMTGRGGWPLNVFLTPEQLPFYGGTYFPPDPRHGMPARISSPFSRHDSAIAWLGASEQGNFHDGMDGDRSPEPGLNVLQGHGPEPPDAVRARIRERLLAARERRTRPGLDDKRLTSWNALMIAALAEAGAALAHDGGERYLDAASACAEFLHERMRDEQGRLLRTYNHGQAKIGAFLEDHAFLLEALIALFEASCDERWFHRALALADETIERFSDPEQGGFFSTAADGEALIARRKDLEDSPIPSGSSSAAAAMLRLAQLTGEETYERHALGAIALAAEIAPRYPSAFGHMLQAMHWQLAPARPLACAVPQSRRS
jgi:uncharacterized protein YyaL (SSP411 family)